MKKKNTARAHTHRERSILFEINLVLCVAQQNNNSLEITWIAMERRNNNNSNILYNRNFGWVMIGKGIFARCEWRLEALCAYHLWLCFNRLRMNDERKMNPSNVTHTFCTSYHLNQLWLRFVVVYFLSMRCAISPNEDEKSELN